MKKIFQISLGILILMLPLISFAEIQTGNAGTIQTGNNGSVITGGGGNTSGGTGFALQNPLGNITDFCSLIVALLKAAIIIAMPIAVLLIVYSGFLFVQAQGKPEALTKAKQNFMWTCVGIGIFFSAWLLAQVIANTVSSVSGFQFCGNSSSSSYVNTGDNPGNPDAPGYFGN